MITLIFDPSKIDSQSLILTIVGIVIVFAALALLSFIFQNLANIIQLPARIEHRRKQKLKSPDKAVVEQNVQADITAAIAMGLHLYFSELHDEEDPRITIKRVSRHYSPWSSKIYNVRNQFNRP